MKTAFLVAALALAGCHAESRDAPAPPASTPAHTAVPAPSARPTLDELDQRRPVPLLPVMAQHQKANMREHLEAVQAVVAAAASGDFDQVAVAAKRMGYSDAMGRMCQHMGAAAPGFTEQALLFHHTADEIVAAATQRDNAAVLAALSKTLRTCTACHAMYKQQLVASLPPP